ncbi:MAG: hypothetical protein K6A65_04340 [Succinivibrionaceae bacterium]|nr:hypothetical protein [Succinivibrionaceae bacterium]
MILLLRENFKSYDLCKLGDGMSNQTLAKERIASMEEGIIMEFDLHEMRRCAQELQSLHRISDLVKGTAEEAFAAAPKIKCQGQELSFLDFASQFANPGKAIDAKKLGDGLVLQAKYHTDVFRDLGGLESIQAAWGIMERTCQAGPLGDDGREALKGDLNKLFSNFARTASEFASQALEKGYSPAAVANHIADTLAPVISGRRSGSELFASKLNIGNEGNISFLDDAQRQVEWQAQAAQA